MPELPEVETIKRGMQKYLVGLKILKVEERHKGIIQGDIKNVEGGKIVDIRRSGKGLIIDLDNKYSLAIHIKLTGQFVFRNEALKDEKVSSKVGSVPNNFTHVIFHLNNGGILYYNDIRRFGWIKIVKTADLFELPFFKAMGPEPFGLGTGEELTFELFEKILSKAVTKIKPLIMDQSKIGGIGNIYANDALFDSRIDPRRSAKTLSKDEMRKLFDSIIKVMTKSLEVGGASELNYVNILGQEGSYQNHTLVYGKSGKPCPRGDGTIQRITLGGRGTFFCEVCQK